MDAKKRFITRIYKASLNGINYITVLSKINSDSVCAFNCSKSDTCVNGSKLRGVCKIRLNERNCKAYDEILGYSITFD